MGEKTVETFRVDLPAEPSPTWGGAAEGRADAEVAAFARLLPELLKTHRGQYVAIHGDRVVDSGLEAIPLILKVHRSIGYVPIHVALVTDEPTPVRRVNLPHGPRTVSQ
ncbi:MAG: hypothetical protein ACRC33_28745 [Gemmataceae bacterium]